jgi:2'-hydroxyisoflavone reductase
VTGADTKITWASPEFLEKHEIIGEKAKGNYMPIWQSAAGEDAGICLASNVRAVKKGLKCRRVEDTIQDTLAWQKTRPADKQKLRAGLTPEMEAELLVKLKA